MRTKERIRFNAKQEVAYQTINCETKEVISEVSPIDKFKGKVFREREFFIIFKRTALNPQTLKNVSGWFAQKILYRIPNREGYDFFYFYFEKGFSLPCARILDPRLQSLCGLTFQVSPQDPKFTKKVGVPKRLSNEDARQCMIDRNINGIDILGLYNDDGYEDVSR